MKLRKIATYRTIWAANESERYSIQLTFQGSQAELNSLKDLLLKKLLEASS